MSKPKWEKNYEAVGEAKLRHARMSARKARLVCDLIRGKSVKEAMGILNVTHRPSAVPDVLQVLKSARDSARQAKASDLDDLVISEAFVDGATMMKRWRAASKASPVRIRKRTCHITIRLNYR